MVWLALQAPPWLDEQTAFTTPPCVPRELPD